MKKILLIVIVLLIGVVSVKEETQKPLPVEFYCRWDDGVIKASPIWFNLPKQKRKQIIDSIYKQNKPLWY